MPALETIFTRLAPVMDESIDPVMAAALPTADPAAVEHLARPCFAQSVPWRCTRSNWLGHADARGQVAEQRVITRFNCIARTLFGTAPDATVSNDGR